MEIFFQLLHRFYNLLHAQYPSLLSSAGKRYTLAPPSIHRDGNKKTVFANITDISKRMHRPLEHVIQFMLAEMGTTGSVDGAFRLVIKGRFQQKQVENVLRRYIGTISVETSYKCSVLTHDMIFSRIRYVQDVQVTGHPSREGKSYLLRAVRVVWFEEVCPVHQDWFPGAGWTQEENCSIKCKLRLTFTRDMPVAFTTQYIHSTTVSPDPSLLFFFVLITTRLALCKNYQISARVFHSKLDRSTSL